MRTLSSEDAFFLYMETPEQHQHVIATTILDPSTVPGGMDMDQFIRKFEADLGALPEFRQKLVRTPLAMTPPVLVDDPDFSYRNHIHRIAVPPPGTLRQLGMIVEDIASTPLSQRRPLWEAWFIEGLSSGCFAIVLKSHHCLADGVQGMESLGTMFDTSPDAAPRVREQSASPQSPASWRIATRALYSQWRYRPGYFEVVGRTARSLRQRRKLFGRSQEFRELVPALFEEAPRLKFNAPISSNRSVAFGNLSLSEVKRVKRALGITVNDVVMSACTLALREYLLAVDDLPDRPLICCMPVSLTLKGEESRNPDTGNQVGTMSVRLPVQLDDVAELVSAVCRSTSAAKEVFEGSFQNLIQNYVGTMPPTVADWLLKSAMSPGVVKRSPTAANLVVSNVPGPPVQLYMNGAKVVASYGAGPIISGQGPNITFISCADKMHFSVQACRQQMPNSWQLSESIESSLEQLLALAEDRAEPVGASA